MLLSGRSNASFLLEHTGNLGPRTFLRPRCTDAALGVRDYASGVPIGPAQAWPAEEVAAAAAWWRSVAMDQEPVHARHVWFGGGVCFGRVTPMEGADVAIDVVVLDDPTAPRPSIPTVESGSIPCTYITVDVTSAEVELAATWWQSLLHS